MGWTRNGSDRAGTDEVDHSTLLGALAATKSPHSGNRTQRPIRAAASLIFVIAVLLLFSACTTEQQQSLEVPSDQPDTATAPAELGDPARQTASSTTSPTATPDTSSSTTTVLAPGPEQSAESPTTTAYADIEPVLSGWAAKPAPVEITQPTPPVASFTVGATATEITISFAADGNGQIDWYSQTPPSGPATYQGKGSTIDITLTIPITEDTRSYLVTADGKNPNAGEDSITILLVRGSS